MNPSSLLFLGWEGQELLSIVLGLEDALKRELTWCPLCLSFLESGIGEVKLLERLCLHMRPAIGVINKDSLKRLKSKARKPSSGD